MAGSAAGSMPATAPCAAACGFDATLTKPPMGKITLPDHHAAAAPFRCVHHVGAVGWILPSGHRRSQERPADGTDRPTRAAQVPNGCMATTTRNCVSGRPIDSSARPARGYYCVTRMSTCAEFTCSPDERAIFSCLRSENIRADWWLDRKRRFLYVQEEAS